MTRISLLLILTILVSFNVYSQKRLSEYGIRIGVLAAGEMNSITDVKGVKVGHKTLVQGKNVRTGATAILPHGGNIFQNKVPAAVFVGNGFGKLTGSTKITELGHLETPIILTNTLNVSTALDAIISHTLGQPGNENVQSVNAVVGETNDGYLNDIRGRHLKTTDILEAINNADSKRPEEGSTGAGTGTVCFGFKGGIGTASRKLPIQLGGYTVGVLVQSNFGGVLQIGGVNVGREMGSFSFSDQVMNSADGSCMIIVATDAPLDSRNLERLAKRAFMGLAKTGGIASNGSGDYVLAFSTAKQLYTPHEGKTALLQNSALPNDLTSPLFMASIEATEEAILNSLFMATTIEGKDGRKVEALPLDKVLPILKKYGAMK